ncbi:MAG TPA: hypothetical protein VGX76_05760, partial [Pirellulales bacterium]|nr:hypothetical protein [Pirellulales bacterium]
QQAAAVVFGSDEYRHDLVAGFFQQYLDRPADPNGESFFVGLLAQGDGDEQVIAAMTAADEYFHKTSA